MNNCNIQFFRSRIVNSIAIPKLKVQRAVLIFLIMSATFFYCALCSTSCASVQTDIRYSGDAGAMHEKTLETLEAAIVSQRIQYSSEQVKRIQADIDTLLKEPSTDSSYLARLYAFSADVYLLQRQPNEARKRLTSAKQQNEYDEYVQLVSARLISDPEKRRAYLEERLVQNPTYYRLKAELGGLYFAAQDYRNALAAFDASLSFLPAEYQRLYSEQRAQSLQLYTIDGASIRKSSEKILQTPQLSLVEMAALTQASTNAFDFITGTAEWKPPLLAEYLQKNGWYHPERNIIKDLTSKKDAALFLWRLIVGNDETRLKKYTRYYTSKRRLPIPDVLIDGVYFDAIVGTVEEDVVPLADGKNFEPDKPVSGMEFYRWLLKADALR